MRFLLAATPALSLVLLQNQGETWTRDASHGKTFSTRAHVDDHVRELQTAHEHAHVVLQHETLAEFTSKQTQQHLKKQNHLPHHDMITAVDRIDDDDMITAVDRLDDDDLHRLTRTTTLNEDVNDPNDLFLSAGDRERTSGGMTAAPKDLPRGADDTAENDETEDADDVVEVEDGFVASSLFEDKKEVKKLAERALADINKERVRVAGEKGADPKTAALSFSNLAVEGAWHQVEGDGIDRYILCLSAGVDGERKFLRLGVTKQDLADESGTERVALNSVSDPLAILGVDVVAAENAELEKAAPGATLGEPATWAEKFPCDAKTHEMFLHGAAGHEEEDLPHGPVDEKPTEKPKPSMDLNAPQMGLLGTKFHLGHIRLDDRGIAAKKSSGAGVSDLLSSSFAQEY